MTVPAFVLPAGEILSDISGDLATHAHLLPSEVACERVVFAGEYDFADNEDQGYAIPLRGLRKDPAGWYRQLAGKRTRPGSVPSTQALQAALNNVRLAPTE